MVIKYWALIRRNVCATLEYRASVLIWILSSVMPLVMLAVWSSMAESGPIAGYSQADLASYFLLLAVVRQLTTAWAAWELDGDIRSGGLAVRLLHPLDPWHGYVAENLSDKLVRATFLAPLCALAFLLFPMIHYDTSPWNVGLFLLALAAAWLTSFLSQYIFGLLAFWISSAQTLHEIWFGFALFLGGMLAPLDLFPPAVSAAARFLPFQTMLSFPVQVLMGRLAPEELGLGFAVAAFWIAVMFIVYRRLWQRGLVRFGANGG